MNGIMSTRMFSEKILDEGLFLVSGLLIVATMEGMLALLPKFYEQDDASPIVKIVKYECYQ